MTEQQPVTTTVTDPGIQIEQQPSKTEPALTQKEVDAIMGRTRKEASEAARKALLKELGIENVDDPKAVETAKTKLTAAQQAEEAQKSELQKLQEANAKVLADLEAEKQLRLAAESKRIADKVDGRIESLATKSGALDATDVSRWLRENQKDAVGALVGDNEQIDDKKAAELIETARKAKPHWFAGAKGAGTGSHQTGTTPGMDDKEARDKHFREYRRGV